jgi:hypothetical protein
VIPALGRFETSLGHVVRPCLKKKGKKEKVKIVTLIMYFEFLKVQMALI